MKILVTGATGFIGRNLVNRLNKQGHKLNLLVRNKINFNKFVKKDNKIFRGDLSNKLLLEEAISGVHVIFHLASGLPYHHLPVNEYYKTNVVGLGNLLNASKKARINCFVHVSTVGIYGPTNNYPADENSPLFLTDAYSKTKAKGEELLRQYMKLGYPATIIRPTIAYGPGDIRPGFLNLFKLIKKGLFISVGRGDNFFHTVYIDNLVDALLLASLKKEAIGEDFIIGDDPCPTMGEFINEVARVQKVKLPAIFLPKKIALWIGMIFDQTAKFGLPAPLNSQRVKFITENKQFKIDKAKKVLGFKAKIGLSEGIKKTYLWYREYGYL